jgi:hypothetical protein
MEFSSLRKKYPRFLYEKYSYQIVKNNLEIVFDFKIEPDIKFNPKIYLTNVKQSDLEGLEKESLDNLIFNLGLIEMISYWKATCSREIKILAGSLNQKQIKWWQDLLIKGLGQFFYENKINFLKPSFLKITAINSKIIQSDSLIERKVGEEYLVPIGGGKDSTIAIEILKEVKKNIRCFSLNPTPAALKIMKKADCYQPIIAKRKIDQKLLELNQQGFLNGHTPFSAYLAFLGLLTATIFKQKYIVPANEKSSNEGNISYLGKIVNHQWSKSFEFEEKFRQYAKKYLTKNIEYFSFLRPLYEIQIAKIFSRQTKYFSSFISCNEAYKTASGVKKPIGNWCGNCSKCLFVYAILYPFLTEKQLLNIFKTDIFANRKLLPTMRQLVGEKGFKPFECVGTKKESLVAFYLSLKKDQKLIDKELPFLLSYFKKNILPKQTNPEKTSKEILFQWGREHHLPPTLARILKNKLSKKS